MREETKEERSDVAIGRYFVKNLLPLAMVVIGGVMWGARLESSNEFLEQRMLDVEAEVKADNKALNLLKVEQTQLAGQIETVRVMISGVADTVTRIERKLDDEPR